MYFLIFSVILYYFVIVGRSLYLEIEDNERRQEKPMELHEITPPEPTHQPLMLTQTIEKEQ